MASMSEIQNFLNKNRSNIRNLIREENDRREASGLPILTEQEIHMQLSNIVDQEKFNLLARAGSRIFGDDELPKPSPFTYYDSILPALSQSRAPASVGKKEADEKKLYDEEQKKKADLCTYKPGMKIEEFIENLFKAGVEPARGSNSEDEDYRPVRQVNGIMTCICDYELVKQDENTWRCTGGNHVYEFDRGDMIKDKFGNMMIRAPREAK